MDKERQRGGERGGCAGCERPKKTQGGRMTTISGNQFADKDAPRCFRIRARGRITTINGGIRHFGRSEIVARTGRTATHFARLRTGHP